MSYNGYSYSPYFQQASENGRSQQAFSIQSQANAPYYRQPQQAVTNSHHYASQQSQYQLPPVSRPGPSVYTEQQYNNTDTARGSRLHSGRDQQPFSPSHTEVHSYNANTAAYTDTSALGSLAYASGLGAEQTGSSAPGRTESPSTGPNMNPAQSQPSTTTTRTSTVGIPTILSTSDTHYPSPRSNSRNSGVTQSDRKATTQQPYGTSGDHQPSESYDLRLSQARHQAHTSHRFENGTTHSEASSELRSGSSSNMSQSGPRFTEPTSGDNSSRHAGHANPQQRMAATQEYQEPTQAAPNVHGTERSTFNAIQYPTTVDPSQVFNHYEYQRRKTAAVAEVLAARRPTEGPKALNEGSNGIRAMETHQSNGKLPGGIGAATASDELGHASPSERDQIEEEMKTMIERMREYKAKNPTLFSQIWEQVKKGQPPNRAPSQTPSSVKEAVKTSETATEKAAKPSEEVAENGQLPSPSLTTVQNLSAAESPPELLPDLGRFPAQRRKRYNTKISQTASAPQLQDTPTQDSTTSVSAQPDFSHHGSRGSVQTNLSEDDLSSAGSANVSKGNVSMRQAMEAFHRASNKVNPITETAGSSGPTSKPSVLTPPSSSIPSGKTIWPENKKMALATAAKIALTSAPVNSGKRISSQEIHQLLDQNPSYTELCENLEARGFVLDRGHFARLLLAAVPDVSPGTASHAPIGSPLQSAHTIGPSPETGHQPSSALATGSSRSEIQAPGVLPGTEIMQTKPTSYDPPHRPLSNGERAQAPPGSASPSIVRVHFSKSGLPPRSGEHNSPRPRGQPRKDGLSSRPLTEAQRNADPLTPARTMKPSLPVAVPVSVNAKDLSTLAPGQLSAPAQPFINPPVAATPHTATITEAAAFTNRPQQARQSRERVIVTDAHVSVPQPRLPLPGSSNSESPAPSGFGMLKLTNTFISQTDSPPRPAQHIAATATYPVASAAFTSHISQCDPSAREPDNGLLNKDLQSRVNGQNGYVNERQPPSVNGAPMYSGRGKTFDKLNTAAMREFSPISAIQQKRAGPSPHAIHQEHQQHHRETISKVLTKQEMARKRNFSDIVDLTQLSDDDQEQHRSKKPRHATGTEMQRTTSDDIHSLTTTLDRAPAVSRLSARDLGIAHLTTMEQKGTRDPATHEQSRDNISAPRSGHLTPATKGVVDLSRFRYAAKDQSVQREILKVADIIQPMDKKNALRRSTYNAKTIARDVLIAAGHHPKDKPLNWHLFPLEKAFRNVNHGSDLSTFNWDLVDPVEQTVPVVTAMEDADADDEGDNTQTGQGFPMRTHIRRHSTRVASATGGDDDVAIVDVETPRLDKGVIFRPQGRRPRHSDTGVHSRPSDSSLSGSTNHRKPNCSSSAAKSEDTRRRLPSGAISAFTSISVSRMPAGITQTSSSNHADVPRVEIVRSPSHTEGSSANPSPSKTTIKRQGQTPGSARSGSSASTDEAPTSEPKRRGRPPGSKNLMSRTASSPGSSGNFSVPARPRGIDTTPARPSGLRNTITPSDGIAVVIVTPRTTNERKRKGSSREPDRSLKAAPDQTMRSSPAYKVYLCEWKGCKAELHNLETLRKHVRKLHRMRPNVDGIPCLWSNCEKTRRIYDKQTGSKKEVHYPHTFSTSTLWDAHMDKKHLEPTAWALGDGPSVHPSDAEASDYLSDSAGRLVTPVARTSGPPDPLYLPSEAGPTRAYHNVHGNRTERARAQAVLATCEARVAAVGPGIDRGGCTMVTPDARERLVDDAFAMRVVDAGDDVPELPGEKPKGKGK